MTSRRSTPTPPGIPGSTSSSTLASEAPRREAFAASASSSPPTPARPCRAQIYAVVRDLAANGAAVQMISSDLEAIVKQAGDVYVMGEGVAVEHPDDAAILRDCYGHDPVTRPETDDHSAEGAVR